MPSRLPLERYCGAITTRDGAQQQGEAASAEFAGEDGGLHDQQRRSQRGDEADAAKRVSENGAADVDEKWNERRLVDVSPGEVVAARHVVELIAKVAVAVVEVDVEDEIGEGDGPDHGHGLAGLVAVWERGRAGHKGHQHS